MVSRRDIGVVAEPTFPSASRFVYLCENAVPHYSYLTFFSKYTNKGFYVLHMKWYDKIQGREMEKREKRNLNITLDNAQMSKSIFI